MNGERRPVLGFMKPLSILLPLYIVLPLLALPLYINPRALIEHLTSEMALRALGLSLETTFAATFLCVLLGTPIAFVLARVTFRGRELVDSLIAASGKTIGVRYVPGPGGVQSRNVSNDRIYSRGWHADTSLRDGIGVTYRWIEQQVRNRLTGVAGDARGSDVAARR